MKWEVTFDGGIIGEDVEVTMCGTAKVDAETEDAATDAGFKKITGLNVFFEDQQLEWEHVRTIEACRHELLGADGITCFRCGEDVSGV